MCSHIWLSLRWRLCPLLRVQLFRPDSLSPGQTKMNNLNNNRLNKFIAVVPISFRKLHPTKKTKTNISLKYFPLTREPNIYFIAFVYDSFTLLISINVYLFYLSFLFLWFYLLFAYTQYFFIFLPLVAANTPLPMGGGGVSNSVAYLVLFWTGSGSDLWEQAGKCTGITNFFTPVVTYFYTKIFYLKSLFHWCIIFSAASNINLRVYFNLHKNRLKAV